MKKNCIFMSICSYRDPLCTKTIESIFENAEYPERIFIGIVQQNAFDDSECANELILQKYQNNIRIIKLNHLEAKGPTWARYLATTLFDNEEYFFQGDSHILMGKKWDTKLINMIKEIKSKFSSQKPLLSHYTKTYEEYGQDNPDNNVPRICKSFFNDRNMISFEGAHDISIDKNTYVQTPYIAAGFIFVESKFLQEVPFDPDLPYLFVGEEILLSIRSWTSGYDIYTPSENLVYHLYTRKDDKKIWTDKTYSDTDAFNKVKLLLNLKPDGDIPKYLLENISRYGLGKERSLDDYYKFAGIDLHNKKVTKNFCHNEDTEDTEDTKINHQHKNHSSSFALTPLITLIIILIILTVFLFFIFFIKKIK